MQITLAEIQKNKYVDLSVLKKASASDMFPIQSYNFSLYKGEPDPANEKYQNRFILCKLTTKTQEILDPDRIALIKEVQDKQDSRVLAEWNMHYRQLNEQSLLEAINKQEKEIQDEEEEKLRIEELPQRSKIRLEAYNSIKKKCKQMKQRALILDGEFSVRDIAKILVSSVNVSKVDAQNLTCIVAEISKHEHLHLTTSKGVLKTTYSRHRVNLYRGVSRELMQLEDTYNRWKGIARYSEREIVSLFSVVRGQDFFKCDYKGNCLLQRYKCKKNNRVYNSRCHKLNTGRKNYNHSSAASSLSSSVGIASKQTNCIVYSSRRIRSRLGSS